MTESDIAAIRDALASYEAWQAHNAANIIEWLTTEQLRAECGRLSEAGAPSPELLLAHAMRALESAQKDAERWRWLREQDGWPDTEAAMMGATPEDFDAMADAHRNAP